LLLVLTPLWAVGLVLAVVAALDRGSPGVLAGVAVLFAVVDPALVGRWLALRGTQEPLLPRPAARRPASPPPVPGPGLVSSGAVRPAGPPASAPRSPGVPVRAGARSHRVPALVAAGLLVVASVGAVTVYLVAAVPGEVVQDVNVRLTPDTRFPPALVLEAGRRVAVECQVNGFGRLSSPSGLEGGFVTLDAVDTYWPPRSC
jgi:hypothetical protein